MCHLRQWHLGFFTLTHLVLVRVWFTPSATVICWLWARGWGNNKAKQPDTVLSTVRELSEYLCAQGAGVETVRQGGWVTCPELPTLGATGFKPVWLRDSRPSLDLWALGRGVCVKGLLVLQALPHSQLLLVPYFIHTQQSPLCSWGPPGTEPTLISWAAIVAH